MGCNIIIRIADLECDIVWKNLRNINYIEVVAVYRYDYETSVLLECWQMEKNMRRKLFCGNNAVADDFE